MYPLQLWGWGINHHTHIPTWEPTAGNVTPCSRKFLIIAEIRLSCGSLRKSSAHSTIRAFSFSQTLGWPWRTHIKAFYANTDQKWTFLKKSHIVNVAYLDNTQESEIYHTPCLRHYWLHWQTLWSTPPSGKFSHSLRHRHREAAKTKCTSSSWTSWSK